MIGEELGLIGSVAVLVFFALFALAGMRIARRSADPFVRLATGGATVWICGQAVINIGYVTALLPVTGIPLPFISAGGTSLLVTFVVFGMLVSFARHEPSAVAAAQRATASGTQGRVSRWARLPMPKAYISPKRSAPSREPSLANGARRAAPSGSPRTDPPGATRRSSPPGPIGGAARPRRPAGGPPAWAPPGQQRRPARPLPLTGSDGRHRPGRPG